MDQDLKQRLVGAAVITSLAAIFVPMIFDDPVDENGKMISELKLPDEPVISNDYSSEYASSNIEEVNLPEVPSLKEQNASRSSSANMSRWFIQVGIFGEESNAYAFRDKVRKQGFPVTITTVPGENGLLYRVRVGPELDKKRAEEMKERIQKLNGLKGILISSTE